jgi:prevent-host-death family protein
MAESEVTHISVAEARRRFADVLGTVRHRDERYVVDRNGTPMAALVPVSDLQMVGTEVERSGSLALVGAFDDEPRYAESLDVAVRSRRTQRSRPAPRLSER